MLRSSFLYIITAVFIFILPFFALPINGWDAQLSKAALFLVWGICTLVYVAFYAIKNRVWRVPFKASLIGIVSIFFFLVLLVSAFFSDSARISFFGDGYAIGVPLFILSALALGYVTSRFSMDGSRGRTLFLAVIGGMIVVTFVSFITILLRKLFNLPDGITSYLLGSVSKWNDVGVYATILLFTSLLSIKRFALSGIGAVIAYGVLVLSVIMLAVVNLVLVWMALLVISLVLLAMFWVHKKKGKAVQTKYAWIMGLLALLSLAFTLDNQFGLLRGYASSFAAYTFDVSSVEAYPSLSSTLSVAKEVLSDSPFFGSGPGRFADVWRMFRPQGVNLSQFWATDFTYGVGFWPTFVVTGGIFAAIAVLAFVVIVLLGAYRLYRKSQGTGISSYVNETVSLTVVFLTVLFCVYSPGWASAMMYAALVGILVGLSYKQETAQSFTVHMFSKVKVVGLIVFMLVFAASTASLWMYGKKVYAHYQYNRALIIPAADTASLFSISERLQKAFNADQRDVYARSLGTVLYAQFNSLLVGSSTAYTSEQFQSMLDSVIGASTNAVLANPYNSQNYIFLGELFRSLDGQGVEGAREQADQAYLGAITYDPHNPLIRVLQARLAFQAGDARAARTKLEEAVTLKPNYTEAVFLLSQLLIERGEADQAIIRLEERAQLQPVEPIVFFQLGFLKYAERDYEGAIPALEQAAILVPDYANALYFLGLSYYYEDRDADAIAVFERIVFLNPDSAEAASILANMRVGRAPFASTAVPPEERDELPVDEESTASEE